MARVKCPHCFHVNPDQEERCQKCGSGLPRIRIETPAPAAQPGQAGKSQLQFHRGQVVAGRYTVLNLIGQGGMGCIYKVHDNTLGEDVALKTLLPQFLEDKVVLERFFNEAKIARRLAHPNIVRVHDIGEDGKVLYISMEYLTGMSLRQILDNLRPGERLPVTQTLRIFDQLCAALEYAHQYTVHRDIKPENVMLGEDGTVRLMDFGISKLMANTRLTNASIVMGTPFYMSPEQIRNSRDVDARADIYSVGVMLYEILTGTVPTGVPKPASQVTKDVPPALDQIVANCVEPDPRARYQNAAELRAAFQPVVQQVRAGISTSKTRVPGARRESDYSPRKIAGGILIAAIVLAAIWGLGRVEERRRALASAPVEMGETEGAPAAAGPALEDYAAVMESLRSRAEDVAGAGLNGALSEGARHWAAAQDAAGADPEAALASARKALQCYLAPLLQREGMVFVPPGNVVIDGETWELPGFLVDSTEVTAGAYARFVDAEEDWTLPGSFATAALDDIRAYPISEVSCIDAMAYAAWNGAELPTEAQWARAAYGDSETADYPWEGEPEAGFCNARFDESGEAVTLKPVGQFEDDKSPYGCFDVVGNISEWTATAASPLEAGALPTFQTLMVVRGGNFNDPPYSLRERTRMRFEEADVTVGFRCVVNIPSNPSAARALLSASS